jgi:capsule polysaccharide export protein KpsE/RkpR
VIPGSTTPTQATQATPSTVTQVVHPQISDFDARLNAIEHKMQLQINTIHENQTTQMQTLLHKFDSTVQTMMTNMNLVMENFGKSLLDMKHAQVSQEQTLSHLIQLTPNPHGGQQNTVSSPSDPHP